MIVEVKEKPYKTVLFWMNKEEAQDKKLMESLSSQFAEWTAKKYRCVVFKSGQGKHMEDSLYSLMKRHYEIIATENSEKTS
ncbi:MAG: hypothetical protein Q4B40_06080 [Clostridia bacterium]|nr:hypothetical protein [Clostridia bacterium]